MRTVRPAKRRKMVMNVQRARRGSLGAMNLSLGLGLGMRLSIWVPSSNWVVDVGVSTA